MSENRIEILLVEDNPNDVELTLRAFKKHKLTNPVRVARDRRHLEQRPKRPRKTEAG